MTHLKKLFGVLCILFTVAGFSLAADVVVTNENELKNAITDLSNPRILLQNSFSFYSNITKFYDKNLNMVFSPTSAVTISGDNQYQGFVFASSSFILTGASTSTFTSFYSAVSSGGVISVSSGGMVAVSSVIFTSNTALSGGVFYSSDTIFNISSSSFTFNTALSSGGAFFIEYSTGIINNLYAASNTASGYGGFFFADRSSFTIIKGTIAANSADYGGALAVSSSTFILNDIYFASNTAVTGGGALYIVEGGTFSVINSTFTGNEAARGGAVYLLSSSSGIFNSIYVTSNSAVDGAGFYVDKSWNMRVKDGYFTQNLASGSGGALYIAASTDTHISNTQLTYNTASVSGGAVFADSSEIYFDTVYAANNSADNGGAFYIQNSTGDIGTVTFASNTALTSGGALYLDSSAAAVSYSNFAGNQASSMGGALYAQDSNLNVANGSFNGNAALSGGAVYVKNSTASFSNVSFTGNTASQSGGAVFIDNGNVTVNGGTFTNNSASANGGAFYVSSNSGLVINAASSEVKFASNTANGSPNDIYLEDNSRLTLNAQNANISLNGGIAHAASPANITIDKTGAKDLQLGGNNVIEADFNLLQGGLILGESASLTMNDLAVTAGNKFFADRNSTLNINNTLEIAEGGSLGTEKINSFYANTLNMYGNLNIGVDMQNGTADLITAGTVNLSSASSVLGLGGNLDHGTSTFTIVNASAINGDFSASSGTYGARINWSIAKSGGIIDLFVESLAYNEIRGLTYNQQQAANLINDQYDAIFAADGGLWKNVVSPMDAMNIEDLKKTLGMLSGSFYADLFKAGVSNNQKQKMFGQLREKDIADENSWVQASGSLSNFKKGDYSDADFEDTNLGVQAGWDLKNDEGLIGGLMIGYQNHDIKQADETALVNGLEAGAYGAWLKNSIELKGVFSLGYQSYETERNIKTLNAKAATANFSGYSASLDAQAGYAVWMIGNVVSVKPFVELAAAAAMNDKVEEEGADFALEIDSQNYFYSDALLGVGFNGYHDKVEWYVSAGAGYILAGAQNEIETKLIQSDGKMKVKGSDQGDMIISAGAGVEVTVNEQFYVYANGGYGTSDGYDNMYGNLGVRYKFLK